MKKADSLRDCWSTGLARGYLAFGLIACATLAMALTARAAGFWAIVPPVVGAAGLALRWQSAPVFVLLGTAIAVMITRESELSRPESVDILLAAALVCYALTLSRLVGLTSSIWPPDPRPQLRPPSDEAQPATTFRDMLLFASVVYPLWQWLVNRPAVPDGDRRKSETAPTDEIGLSLIAPAAALAIAFLIWRIASILPEPPWVEALHWRLGVMIWVLIVSAITVRVVIGILAARRMPIDQAQMVLNDVVWTEHRRELHRVGRFNATKRHTGTSPNEADQ